MRPAPLPHQQATGNSTQRPSPKLQQDMHPAHVCTPTERNETPGPRPAIAGPWAFVVVPRCAGRRALLAGTCTWLLPCEETPHMPPPHYYTHTCAPNAAAMNVQALPLIRNLSPVGLVHTRQGGRVLGLTTRSAMARNPP